MARVYEVTVMGAVPSDCPPVVAKSIELRDRPIAVPLAIAGAAGVALGAVAVWLLMRR